MQTRIVEVIWEDARVSVDGEIPTLPLMRSMGIIIKRDKKMVCVCSLFGEDMEPRVVTSIPTSLIRKIKRV